MNHEKEKRPGLSEDSHTRGLKSALALLRLPFETAVMFMLYSASCLVVDCVISDGS